MITIVDLFSGPRLKVQRANRHIDELRQRSVPLDRELYEITNRLECETVIHVNPTKYKVTFRPKQNIPKEFALIIGDAIGNLRSALDYLANGIARAWISPESEIHFPFSTERKNLISNTYLATIEKAVPGSKKLFLDEVRPENGPNEHLWNFHTFRNDDQHNDFIPTVTVITINNINAHIGTNTFQNCGVGFDATSPHGLFISDMPITIKNNFNTAVEVKFCQGTIFENEPVIPTLTQITELVSDTLNWFEALIKREKKII